jgi:hypothetical protein
MLNYHTSVAQRVPVTDDGIGSSHAASLGNPGSVDSNSLARFSIISSRSGTESISNSRHAVNQQNNDRSNYSLIVFS